MDSYLCIGCGLCTTKCKFDAIHLKKVRDWHAGSYETMPIKVAEGVVKRAGSIVKKGGQQVMHELALCDAMLKMVRDISREQALEGVRSITVRVGTLSGVVPRFLTDCWVAVTDGTEYDGVPLRIETEAGRARCLDCGAEFVADVEALSCPDCGGKKLMPLSGRDMTIQEIEAY